MAKVKQFRLGNHVYCLSRNGDISLIVKKCEEESKKGVFACYGNNFENIGMLYEREMLRVSLFRRCVSRVSKGGIKCFGGVSSPEKAFFECESR